MNAPTSDHALGQRVRELAASLGYSPEALLQLAAAADYSRRSVRPNFGPQPELVAEVDLTEEDFTSWPVWSAPLISSGCRLDELQWPDGIKTVRLLSRRGLVLAATSTASPTSLSASLEGKA